MYPLRPRPYRREGIAWLPYAIGAGRPIPAARSWCSPATARWPFLCS